MGLFDNLFDKSKKAREILTTNPKLICEKCGKKPLIFESDRYGIPVVDEYTIDMKGIKSRAAREHKIYPKEKFLELSHLAYSGIAIKCPNCNKILCISCYDESSCPICGGIANNWQNRLLNR
jgi:hypothetical protein